MITQKTIFIVFILLLIGTIILLIFTLIQYVKCTNVLGLIDTKICDACKRLGEIGILK